MLREEDVRAVVALCPLCHMCHSVDGKQVRVNGEKLPGISNANMIWIKKNRDAELYDEEYLKKVWCGAVPEPVQPSMYFMLEFGVR